VFENFDHRVEIFPFFVSMNGMDNDHIESKPRLMRKKSYLSPTFDSIDD